MNEERLRAREVVRRHGYNVTAYQIVNPGLAYWFSRRHDAVAGFVRRGGAWVVAGAPVCAAGDLGEVVAEVERAAGREGRSVCYVCAGERMRAVADASGRHRRIAIGAQPVWDPRDWPAVAARARAVRAQLNRVRNKGVVVEEMPGPAARGNVELRACLASWVADRPMPPIYFLAGVNALDGLMADRTVFVARVGGEAVAFLLATPVPARRGYLVEQIARTRRAPNGTAELLIDAAMRWAAGRGAGMVTLGMVALSTHALPDENPAWARALFAWARLHGRRFYRFDGLERFREKLCPSAWEPLYAIANRGTFGPRDLYAAGAAFCRGSVASFAAHAAGRALGDEGRRLTEWLAGFA